MTASKRIAIYISSFPPKSGGIAAAHYNLFVHLAKLYDVRAFVFADDSERSSEQVIRGKPYPGQRAFFRSMLRRLLKQPRSAFLPQIDSIASAAANVVTMNGPLKRFRPDLIISPDFDIPALLMNKPAGAKLAWMARHNYLRFTQQPLLPPTNFDDLLLAHRLEKRALKKADLVISPSQYMIDVFDRTLGTDVPKYVAKNFVAEERLQSIAPSDLRAKMSLAPQQRLIYIPDGGTATKGARYTYEILRRLAGDRRLGVYISGAVSACLRYELESCPLLVVLAPGQVPYEQNLANVAACDLTVSPTLAENLSNALVESIMLGVPVITFDTGGNREVIHDGKTGFVVPYADVDGLITCAAKLLASCDELRKVRQSCSAEARQIVNTDEIIGVYEKALADSN